FRSIDERRPLLRHEMVDAHRDAPAAGRIDELGRLLDRLGTRVFRAVLAGCPAGHIDRGAGGAELMRDAAARTTRRPGDQRHLAVQRHRLPPVVWPAPPWLAVPGPAAMVLAADDTVRRAGGRGVAGTPPYPADEAVAAGRAEAAPAEMPCSDRSKP